MAAGSLYTASARIAQKAQLPTFSYFFVLHNRYLAMAVSLVP
jgi:hypothetical protein